jgi:hypothetical protein
MASSSSVCADERRSLARLLHAQLEKERLGKTKTALMDAEEVFGRAHVAAHIHFRQRKRRGARTRARARARARARPRAPSG